MIGTAFYIMDYCDGRVLWDPLLPELPKEARLAIHRAKFETLTRLHAVDYVAPRPCRLRPAGQLRGAADLALGEAVQGVGNREDRVDGPAARLAAGAPAGQ